MSNIRHILLNTAGIGFATTIFATVALMGAAKMEHWSFNMTTCMPLGFYQRGPVPTHIQDGDTVFFCPPVGSAAMHQAMSGLWLEYAPHGNWDCQDHLMPFMKEVVSTPGQKVVITKKGVIANGRLLPNSRVMTHIEDGKIPVIHLPYGTYTVPKGQFWDYAPGNFAYTSAYYGPVPLKNIKGAIHPVPFLTIPGSQYWQKH